MGGISVALPLREFPQGYPQGGKEQGLWVSVWITR